MRTTWMVALAVWAASAGCGRASYRTSYGGDASGYAASTGDESGWTASGLTAGLSPPTERSDGEMAYEEVAAEAVVMESVYASADASPTAASYSSGGGSGGGEMAGPPPIAPEIAEAMRAREVSDAERARLAEATTRAGAEHDTDDAGAPALMVYTAGFYVGVYQVRQAQDAIAETARSLGGFVASQNDEAIVIRVPVARFFEAVEAVSGTGDVLHRDVRATDVSEEFHDNDIRIRNLEAMRDRLAELLRRADDVEDALAVEAQLERITVELERLRGRQRFLADRVSLSTISVTFRALAVDPIEDAEFFVLPFEWLRSLGLPSLLSVE